MINKNTSSQYLKLIFKNDRERRDISERLNIIEEKNVSFLYDIDDYNKVYKESYGTMYFNYVTIRQILYSNSNFVKNLLYTLAKIVHPNIQMYYGLMFKGDNCYIVLENVASINLNEMDYLNYILNEKEILYLKVQILSRIAQTLSFLYESERPYLFTNCHNIKLNYKLLSDRHQHLKVIYCENAYIESNLIKLTQIGMYLQFDKQFKEIFSIKNEDIYNITYHSPEMLLYLCSDNTNELPNNKQLQLWDVWSFGCLIYEVVFGENAYKDMYNREELIQRILEEKDFMKSHSGVLGKYKGSKYKDSVEEIGELIGWCTCKEGRICFKKIVEVLEKIRNDFKEKYFDEKEINDNKEKVNSMDFQYYHLPKFEEINLLALQIKEFHTLDEDITKTEKEIKYLKSKLINKSQL